MNTKLLATRIRKDVLKMTSNGKSSHVGSALSIVDIISVLYVRFMKINSNNCRDTLNTNNFILSKGHAGAAIYSLLANLNLMSKKKMMSHYTNGSYLSGHVSHYKNPGIVVSTGSLGNGLSIGCGLALSKRQNNIKTKVYVLVSDGEINEGCFWEAIMFAQHHKLSNLICLIDKNKYQSIKSTKETLDLDPLKNKFKSFNWDYFEADGHCHKSINQAINKSLINFKPSVISFNTIKGKGISFMENQNVWHYKYCDNDQLKRALSELDQ